MMPLILAPKPRPAEAASAQGVGGPAERGPYRGEAATAPSLRRTCNGRGARSCPSRSDKNSAKRSVCTRSIRFRTRDATRSPLSSGQWSELLVGSELLVRASAAGRTRRLRSRQPPAFRLCRGVKSSYFCPYLFSQLNAHRRDVPCNYQPMKVISTFGSAALYFVRIFEQPIFKAKPSSLSATVGRLAILARRQEGPRDREAVIATTGSGSRASTATPGQGASF